MAFSSLVQHKFKNSLSGTSYSVVLDAAPISGHLLVAVYEVSQNPAGGANIQTGPSGWAQISGTFFSGSIGGASCQVAMWWKKAGVSESATQTFGVTNATSSSSKIDIMEFSGADQTTPTDGGTNKHANASGLSGTPGSTGTLANANDLIVAALSTGGGNISTSGFAVDSSFNLVQTGLNTALATAYKIKAGSTDAENPSFSWTTNNAATEGIIAAFKAAAITGTGSAPLGPLTATATGIPTVSGTAAAALGGLSATATGTPTVTATGTAALGGLAASATGTPKVSATGNAPLGALTATATGTPTVVASGSAALGSLTAIATGTPTVTGTGNTPLGALTASATGTPADIVSGTAALGALDASGLATPTVTGTANAPLGSLTASGSAIDGEPATGSAALGALTASATGTATHVVTPPRGGGGTVQPRPFQVNVAIGQAPLGPLDAEAAGTVSHLAVVRASFTPQFTARATRTTVARGRCAHQFTAHAATIHETAGTGTASSDFAARASRPTVFNDDSVLLAMLADDPEDALALLVLQD